MKKLRSITIAIPSLFLSLPFLTASQKLYNNNGTLGYRSAGTLLVSSEDWYEKAKLQIEKGNYQKAEEYLLKATNKDNEKSEIDNGISFRQKSKHNQRLGKLMMAAADSLILGPVMNFYALELVKTAHGSSVNKHNPLVGIKTYSGQVRWVSPSPIGSWHVKEIVMHLKKYDQSVHINTGGHGKFDGTMVRENALLADVTFIKEDIELIFSEQNVSLHIMSSYSGAIYPSKANHVIDAWCYSQKTMEKQAKPFNEQAEKEWLEASQKGDLKKLKNLLQSFQINIEAVDKDGYNTLHYACLFSGSVDMVTWLLDECKIDIETKGQNQRTPFLCASEAGQLKVAKLLKKRDANINATDRNGNNALHFACLFSESVDMVTWLLDECKISIETKGQSQRTPFLCAAEKGQLKVAKLLRERDANINAKSDSGNNALHYASLFSGSVNMTTWLLDVCKISIETEGRYQRTPFLCAAENGQFKIVTLLRERGANINAKDENGYNALHLTFATSSSIPMITWLLDVCNISIEAKGYEQKTPFLCAAEGGQLKIAKLLRKRGANIKATDKEGDNALHWACLFSRNVGMTTWLLDVCNISIESKGRYQKTPFICAAEGGQLKIAKLLKERGANIKATDEEGDNALCYAKFKNNKKMIRYLQSLGLKDNT